MESCSMGLEVWRLAVWGLEVWGQKYGARSMGSRSMGLEVWDQKFGGYTYGDQTYGAKCIVAISMLKLWVGCVTTCQVQAFNKRYYRGIGYF